VASELGVSPAALYWYVKDKQELLRALVEHVQAPHDRPDLDHLEWRAALRTGARFYHQRFLDHPQAAALMVVTPLTSEHGWVTVERTLRVLHRAGFRDQALIDAANAFIGYVGGYIALEVAMGGQPLTPQTRRQVRVRFRPLDPERLRGPVTVVSVGPLVDGSRGIASTPPLRRAISRGRRRQAA
jgi:AcrR family transcriptional regulator